MKTLKRSKKHIRPNTHLVTLDAQEVFVLRHLLAVTGPHVFDELFEKLPKHIQEEVGGMAWTFELDYLGRKLERVDEQYALTKPEPK